MKVRELICSIHLCDNVFAMVKWFFLETFVQSFLCSIIWVCGMVCYYKGGLPPLVPSTVGQPFPTSVHTQTLSQVEQGFRKKQADKE